MMTRSAQRRIEKDGGDASKGGQPAGVTLAEWLRGLLEERIASGRLEPGERLDEQEVAQSFGVSRTPVREAFRLLAAGNLVEIRGRQGAVVRAVGAHTLIEMFQVMAELEGLCARLAARRITPERRKRIEDIHRRLTASAESGEGVDAFYDVNQEFHEAIYEASCNAFLAGETRKLRNQVAGYRRRVTRMPNRIAKTIVEHEEVIDAIVSHDPERADRAMQLHVNLLGDDLADFLATFD